MTHVTAAAWTGDLWAGQTPVRTESWGHDRKNRRQRHDLWTDGFDSDDGGANTGTQTRKQHRWHLHALPKSTTTEPVVTARHEVSSSCLLLAREPGIIPANTTSSYLSFRLGALDKHEVALWVTSVACQCSPFDGPGLVRYLITLLW